MTKSNIIKRAISELCLSYWECSKDNNDRPVKRPTLCVVNASHNEHRLISKWIKKNDVRVRRLRVTDSNALFGEFQDVELSMSFNDHDKLMEAKTMLGEFPKRIH